MVTSDLASYWNSFVDAMPSDTESRRRRRRRLFPKSNTSPRRCTCRDISPRPTRISSPSRWSCGTSRPHPTCTTAPWSCARLTVSGEQVTGKNDDGPRTTDVTLNDRSSYRIPRSTKVNRTTCPRRVSCLMIIKNILLTSSIERIENKIKPKVL